MSKAKLTQAQRDLLGRAVARQDGNPWPTISMHRRKGGALNRCFERMKADGLFDAANTITEKGRAALKEIAHD